MKKIITNNDVDEIVGKIRKLPPERRDAILSEFLYIKANGLLEKKKYTDVIKTINAFLKKDPTAMGFLALKFKAYRKLHKIHSAKRILITMTKIDRGADTIDSRFCWPTTRTLFYEEALPFLETIIKKNLKNPVPIETKGRIFGLLGRHDDLLTLVEWIYKIEPRNHSAPVFREYILYRLGRRDNPIPDIDKIIKDAKTKNKKVLAHRDNIVKEILEMEKNGRVYLE